MQMPPISFPHSTDDDEGSKFSISNVEMSEIECPPGTVPILTSYNGSMSTRSFDKIIYSENRNDKGNRQVRIIVL